jgi:putative SOS response-associated peptidase YedK
MSAGRPNAPGVRRAAARRHAFTVATRDVDFTRCIHDRIPVLLEREEYDAWLTGKAGAKLLRPAPNDLLRLWPVSKKVNVSGRGDDDGIVKLR